MAIPTLKIPVPAQTAVTIAYAGTNQGAHGSQAIADRRSSFFVSESAGTSKGSGQPAIASTNAAVDEAGGEKAVEVTPSTALGKDSTTGKASDQEPGGTGVSPGMHAVSSQSVARGAANVKPHESSSAEVADTIAQSKADPGTPAPSRQTLAVQKSAGFIDASHERSRSDASLSKAVSAVGASVVLNQPLANAQNGTGQSAIHDMAAFAGGSGRQSSETTIQVGSIAGGDGQAAKDALAALDSGRAPAESWIHTSGHHAEAGYLDPALGWVGVRADSVAGSVHASVVPGSAEAAQVLGNHLVGLNAYLAEHHQQQATVALANPQSRLDGSGLNNSATGGGAEESSSGRGSNSSDNGHPQVSSASPVTTRSVSPTVSAAAGSAVALDGMHISVIA